MTLSELTEWVRGVPDSLPTKCVPWQRASARPSPPRRARLIDLGLGYLALDRSAATLSTGERQRMQLARAVRNRTTGVLYVLDEPSIGLHPANIVGLTGVMHDLVADGNSVLLVDHDTQILRKPTGSSRWARRRAHGRPRHRRRGRSQPSGRSRLADRPFFMAGRRGTAGARRAEELFARRDIRLSTEGSTPSSRSRSTCPRDG